MHDNRKHAQPRHQHTFGELLFQLTPGVGGPGILGIFRDRGRRAQQIQQRWQQCNCNGIGISVSSNGTSSNNNQRDVEKNSTLVNTTEKIQK